MSDEKLPESVYRELLSDTQEVIKAMKKLMMSEEVDIQVFAVDAFLRLSELAVNLTEVLGEPSEHGKNPLARRARLDL
jgi:ATP-dependent protease HslVU (ClpYQ) ATPase subunit